MDDKPSMVTLLDRILSEDYSVKTCSSGTQALVAVASEQFDVVLTDIRMPGAGGFDVLRAVKAQAQGTEVILITAYASVEKAVEAIREGAYDYIRKPFQPNDIRLKVARAVERKRLRDRAAKLEKRLEVLGGDDRLVGDSPPMLEVYHRIDQAANLDITVLLTGESGTGKELVARAIHDRSGRRDAAFVPVNCGALPEELVESELFGHVKGAFTGAGTARKGLFTEADRGTLFLDEIGELPPAAQVKLTRVLQEREVRPVGGTRAHTVDCRVVAATLKDLKEEVVSGRFREDLFYRLNVFPIHLPPLRERKEDIPLLAEHFLRRHATRMRRTLTGFSPDAMAALTRHTWPGNVRELSNAIERSCVLATEPVVRLEDLPAEVSGAPGAAVPGQLLADLTYKEAMDLARDHATYAYLTAIMERFEGHVTRAAEHAGLERGSLHRLLKRHGLRSEDFKGV